MTRPSKVSRAPRRAPLAPEHRAALRASVIAAHRARLSRALLTVSRELHALRDAAAESLSDAAAIAALTGSRLSDASRFLLDHPDLAFTVDDLRQELHEAGCEPIRWMTRERAA